MEDKYLLRAFMYKGSLNVEKAEQVKREMFAACSLDVNQGRDRAIWSNWINCKCAPNRWCKERLNSVVTNLGYAPIYIL